MTDTSKNPYTILLYYKYTPITNPDGFMKWHKDFCSKLGIKARILIATEGINGTLEGTHDATETYIETLHGMTGSGSENDFGDFKDIMFKKSPGTGNAFPNTVQKRYYTLSFTKR